MNHLANIANRQRNTRVRDALFAAFLALGVVISVTSLTTAVQAASTHVVAR